MKNFIQITLIILFAILFLNQCRVSQEKETIGKNNQLALLDTVSYYKNKLDLEVAEKTTFKGSAKELKFLFDAEKQKNIQFAEASKKWKNLYNAAIIELEFKVDSLHILFNKPIDYSFSRKFSKKTKDYFLKGSVNEFGVNIDFRALATITPFTGNKKSSLFSSDYKTEITSSSELLKVKDFKNFNFTERKKRFGVGFSVGFGFYQDGFFLGPSINYNLIQF